MQRRKRVALVIGAGSVKCAAAIGLAKVLARENIALDLLVGCSAGSMVAALIGLGKPTHEITALAARLWTRELTSERDTRAMLSILLPRLLGFDARFGMRRDRRILRAFAEAYGEARIEDMKVPLLVTATDFWTGEQVIFDKGRLVDALRASIALPFILKPWEVEGRLCIDGFLSDPLPVGPAVREGADVIIAMGFESAYNERIDSAARFAFQLTSIMTNNLLRSRFAFHNVAHHGEVIAIVPEFKERIRLFDADKIPYIIEEGERATDAILPHLLNVLAETPAPVAVG
ncbi:MAG TPA: patatin-like phospholipase family protein [Casimicrobiaceae bacterium]